MEAFTLHCCREGQEQKRARVLLRAGRAGVLERLLCIDAGLEGPEDEVAEIVDEPGSSGEAESGEGGDGTSTEPTHT